MPRANGSARREAEQALLEAYRGGKMHHAWLFGGPKGIGKATLAYRFARFALAHPDPASPEVAAATDLGLAADHPTFRKVAARAHPNLLVLERPWDEERKRYRTELTVPEIRRTVGFFGSTAAEDGWRIAIVDPADDMNASAANALLKVLEEPPARSLFLLVCHAPGRLIATIRSRCRRLDLAPLPRGNDRPGARRRGGGCDGHPAGRRTVGGKPPERDPSSRGRGAGAVSRVVAACFRGCPTSMCRRCTGSRSGPPAAAPTRPMPGFLEHLRGWLARRVRREAEPEAGASPGERLLAVPLERWAEVWEKVNHSSDLAEALNLDRKQVVLSIFMTLARATRM